MSLPALMNLIFGLILWFMAKHSIADYALQLPFKFMYGKFKGRGWAKALAAHCGVHALFTLIIAWTYTGNALTGLLLGAMDFWLHFAMDRIKASPKLLGRFKTLNAREWEVANNMAQGLASSTGYTLPSSTWKNPDERKAYIDEGKRLLRQNMIFWLCLELDQRVHALTDLLSAYIIIQAIVSNATLGT